MIIGNLEKLMADAGMSYEMLSETSGASVEDLKGLAAGEARCAFDYAVFHPVARALGCADDDLVTVEVEEGDSLDDLCYVVANAPTVELRLRDLLDYCESRGIRSEELSSEEAAAFIVGDDDKGVMGL